MPTLSSKYDLISGSQLTGAGACLVISDVAAQEAITAFDAGSGPGVPDTNGTPALGTLISGQVVTLNSNGYWDLATSPDLSVPNFPIVMGVMHDGDEDFDGAYTGKPVVLVGLCEILTDQISSGTNFPPGSPLTVSAGKFLLKSSAASGLQVVGRVGNRGYNNGVLHVMFGVP